MIASPLNIKTLCCCTQKPLRTRSYQMMSVINFLILLAFLKKNSDALSLASGRLADKSGKEPKIESTRYSRRLFLSTTLPLIPALSSPKPVSATIDSTCALASSTPRVKGAAEYDLEYYLRDLWSGNKREGSITQSKPPPTPPPRKLGGGSSFNLVTYLLNDGCTSECLAVSELSKLANIEPVKLTSQIKDMRDKVSKSFYSKSPWNQESVLDEYYFDMTSYALFRVASSSIPDDYKLRDKWIRSVGNQLYNQAKATNLLLSPTQTFGEKQREPVLTDSIPTLIQALDLFQSINFIESYRLGEKGSGRTYDNIFDTYDNQDFEMKQSVNCLISVTRPATMGSALQITGEGSRFIPDFISPTIAALFEDILGGKVTVEWESYFVDSQYRPNPKDFFPDEILLQLTLTPLLKKD